MQPPSSAVNNQRPSGECRTMQSPTQATKATIRLTATHIATKKGANTSELGSRYELTGTNWPCVVFVRLQRSFFPIIPQLNKHTQYIVFKKERCATKSHSKTHELARGGVWGVTDLDSGIHWTRGKEMFVCYNDGIAYVRTSSKWAINGAKLGARKQSKPANEKHKTPTNERMQWNKQTSKTHKARNDRRASDDKEHQTQKAKEQLSATHHHNNYHQYKVLWWPSDVHQMFSPLRKQHYTTSLGWRRRQQECNVSDMEKRIAFLGS